METNRDRGEFLQAAWQAAQASGEIIRANWQRSKTIDYKGAIDLVTSVDRESERIIVELLRRDFPRHAVLAEEETNVEGAESAFRLDPDDVAERLAVLRARRVTIAGAGHHPQLERPEETAAVLIEFLNGRLLG